MVKVNDLQIIRRLKCLEAKKGRVKRPVSVGVLKLVLYLYCVGVKYVTEAFQ